MKSILLIGLGRFGRHMAKKFQDLNNEVLAIDINETRVNEALPYVTNAQIGDATSDAFIESLGVGNFDICVVAIGDNFQSSLEATALLKEYGATFVAARASREVHAKFLLRNGADEVLYPEMQMATWAAVKYSSEHIFDYIELTEQYSIFETSIPEDWLGKSVIELKVRQKYRINILGVKREGVMLPLPGPDYCFGPGETLFILGDNQDVLKFLNL